MARRPLPPPRVVGAHAIVTAIEDRAYIIKEIPSNDGLPGEDAHVEYDEGRHVWVVDIFDGNVEDPDLAHLRTEEYPTLAKALNEVAGPGWRWSDNP